MVFKTISRKIDISAAKNLAVFHIIQYQHVGLNQTNTISRESSCYNDMKNKNKKSTRVAFRTKFCFQIEYKFQFTIFVSFHIKFNSILTIF